MTPERREKLFKLQRQIVDLAQLVIDHRERERLEQQAFEENLTAIHQLIADLTGER